MSEALGEVGPVPPWDVADKMRKALRHSEVGVQEMARYLDVDRSTVSTWINGRIQPSTQTLRLWALRTGVPYEWLRDGAEPHMPPPTGEPGADPTYGYRRRSLRLVDGMLKQPSPVPPGQAPFQVPTVHPPIIHPAA